MLQHVRDGGSSPPNCLFNWTDDMHNLYSGAPYPPGARTNVKRCESVFYVFDAVQRVSSVQLVVPTHLLFSGKTMYSKNRKQLSFGAIN